MDPEPPELLLCPGVLVFPPVGLINTGGVGTLPPPVIGPKLLPRLPPDPLLLLLLFTFAALLDAVVLLELEALLITNVYEVLAAL